VSIDVATLVFLESLAGVVLTLVLLLVGRLLCGEPGLWPWVLAIAVAAAGSLLTALGGGAAHAEAAGAILLAHAPALVWVGTRDRCGLPRRTAPLLASAAIVCAASLLGDAQRAAPIASAAWSGAIAWTALRHAPTRRRAGTRAAVGLFLVHGLFQLARCFLPPPGEAAPLLGVAEWPRALVAIGGIFFTVAWALAVLGLTAQRLLAKLREEARTDGLTGLPNRFAFVEDARRVLEFCRRRRRPCAVVLADLDHFKRLNDTEGHAAGDRALRLFAAEAVDAAGKAIVLGRLGGEEFCAVLPGADAAQARAWAERLRLRVVERAPFTVSFGVAAGVGEELELERMIARADEALYRAKAGGRNRVAG